MSLRSWIQQDTDECAAWEEWLQLDFRKWDLSLHENLWPESWNMKKLFMCFSNQTFIHLMFFFSFSLFCSLCVVPEQKNTRWKVRTLLISTDFCISGAALFQTFVRLDCGLVTWFAAKFLKDLSLSFIPLFAFSFKSVSCIKCQESDCECSKISGRKTPYSIASLLLVDFMALIFLVVNLRGYSKNTTLLYRVNAQRLNLPVSVVLLSDRDKGKANSVLHLGPRVFTHNSPAGWICVSNGWLDVSLVCVCIRGKGAGILIFSLYQDTTLLMDYPSLPSMPQERCLYGNTEVRVCVVK